MAEVEELLDDVTVRMPSGAELRARGRRRTVRRRAAVAAAVTAVVAGAVTWVAMPGDGRGREVRPAADVGDNPYKTDGVIHLLTANQLPLDDVRHWKPSPEQGADSPLPELSFGSDCPAGAPQPHEIDGVRNQERATASFIGDRHSRARQRYIEYDRPADATVELDALRKALISCGLKRHGKAPGTIYSGKDKDGQGILVQLDHGERWTSVLEVRGVTQGMNPG